MDFAKLAQISVGLAAFLGGLWIVLLIIRIILTSKKNGNGNGDHKSAGLTANEWKTAINLEVKKALDETAPKRHDDLRKLIKEVLHTEFLERDKTLRELIHGELERLGK